MSNSTNTPDDFNSVAEILVIKNELSHIRRSLDDILIKLALHDERYVTQDQFYPVKMVVYGLCAAVGSAFVTHLLGFWG